jgi:hypothetical protein
MWLLSPKCLEGLAPPLLGSNEYVKGKVTEEAYQNHHLQFDPGGYER